MHPARPNRSLASLAVLAAVAVLLTACSSSSDAQPGSVTPVATSAAVTSASAADPTTGSTSGSTSAPPSASASPSASALPSASASTTAKISGTTSVPLSSRSSRSAPSTPEPSGSAAVGSFDAGTVRYFAALCSGLQDKPRDRYEGLTGDLATKRTETAALFAQQAERLDGATEGMKAAGIPNIPEGAKLASVTIATYPAVATAARSGAKLVAGASTQAELDEKFQAAREATDAAGAPLNDLAEIIGAPAVVGQMKKIAACASVLNS